MNASAYLCVVGSSNIDHVVEVAEFPRPGQTLAATAYRAHYGGKGANQAVAAYKAGVDVHFISGVGDDSAGAAMVDHFSALGLDTRAIARYAKTPTGLAMIQVNSHGENTIVVAAGANSRLSAQVIEAQRARIEAARFLLLQLETPLDGVTRAIEIAAAAGVPVVLNPAPACQLPDHLFKPLTLITPNENEAKSLTGVAVDDPRSAARAAQVLRQKGVPRVMITMGGRGVFYRHETGEAFYPAFPVQAVDTTAAGDAFHGALLTALVEGAGVPQAIRFAQAAAALSVQKAGAESSLPSRDAIMGFLRNETA